MDDEQRANVVVMGEAFWRTRFNADPAVVGRELRLDGLLWTGRLKPDVSVEAATSDLAAVAAALSRKFPQTNMVGVFGILAYWVQQQVRELGLRRALGTSTADVLRPVAAGAVRIVAGGVALGLVLAAISSQFIATMLFGVQPLDVPTFGVVTALLMLTATLAIAGPAWRAARIDPAIALRSR